VGPERQPVKRRCVFLDRDGVINVKPVDEYLRRWDEFRFLPGIVDWIRLFKALGFLVVVITNQRGVARGLTDPRELSYIHSRMAEELAAQGAALDGILCCPHDEGTCNCRKPRPGMVHEAQRRWNIDLRESLLIGDSPTDGQLAETCGMTFVLARDGRIVEVVAVSPRSA
jgi:histidinol-phosphate phosphatase family protein